MGTFSPNGLCLCVCLLHKRCWSTHWGCVFLRSYVCTLWLPCWQCVGDGWQLCMLPVKSHRHIHTHTSLACSFSSQLISMKVTRLSNGETLCHCLSSCRHLEKNCKFCVNFLNIILSFPIYFHWPLNKTYLAYLAFYFTFKSFSLVYKK